jgi:FKBP-type peptidyl-prolyl cis-trans isomerase FklB
MKPGFHGLLLVVLGFGACSGEPFPGMNRVGEQVYMQLHRLGDGMRSPMAGDQVGIRFSVSLLEPQEYLHTAQRFINYSDPTLKALNTVLKNRVVGDSISVILPASKLPWDVIGPEISIQPGPERLVEVGLLVEAVLTPEEAELEEARLNKWLKERRLEAERSMHAFLVKEGLDPDKDSFGGVYVTIKEKGDGELISFGDRITINYQGRFLNGRVFDDTYASGAPMSFNVGEQGQVIWGLSLAVRKLSAGAKARVYIPYAYGFGSSGSSTGIVPPFANIIYDIEVMSVLRP